MNINIKSIATGKSKEYKIKQKSFESAYLKDEFHDSIKVTFEGLEGDEQVDKRFHGGVDKAIHFGSNRHSKKNPNFDRLSIGCNILVKRITEVDVCIGDIYRIGEVRVQVTQPRQPCWKIGALFGKDIRKYITKKYATGWYVKVLNEGTINIDDKMILERRISNLSIKNLAEYLIVPPTDKRVIDEILNSECIANSYRKDFLYALEKNNS